MAEKFVITKITGKNSDKYSDYIWIWSCLDWYGSMIIKLVMNSGWSTWKNKFCELFENKGWTSVTFALLFNYRNGSLLDYAKKKKLLLDIGKLIDTCTLVDIF